MADRFYFVKCSVIRHRHGTPVLYPLGEDKEKLAIYTGRGSTQ